MLTLLVAGAALVLLAAGRPWVHVQLAVSAGLPTTETTVTGNSTYPVSALAIVGLAAAGGLLAARGVLRRAVGLIAFAAGAVVVFAAVLGLATSARADDAARDSGNGATVSHSSGTAWPVAALLGGVLIGLGGAATVVGSGSWRAMGARYDAAPVRQHAVDPWTALDRGADPTLDP